MGDGGEWILTKNFCIYLPFNKLIIKHCEMDLNLEKIILSFERSWDKFVQQIPGVFAAILIVSIGIFVANKITDVSKKVIKEKSSDPLMANFLLKTIKFALLVVIGMFALRVAGLEGIAAGVLTAAGASAVILGFAFKDIGENFISGIILSFNRPFNVHDIVSIGDVFGIITSMEFRYTKIRTFDGKNVYIPNSDVIKKPVQNYTEEGAIRLDYVVGIDYENNIHNAKKIIEDILNANENVLKDPAHVPFVLTEELASNSVNLKVFFWVKSADYRKDALLTKSSLIETTKKVFAEKGIAIPTNIQEIKWYQSPELNDEN